VEAGDEPLTRQNMINDWSKQALEKDRDHGSHSRQFLVKQQAVSQPNQNINIYERADSIQY
jgi:hypothetical protein